MKLIILEAMIDYTQLRLGNLVTSVLDEGPVEVISITKQKAVDGDLILINGYIPQDIIPIPIRTDILLRLGFCTGQDNSLTINTPFFEIVYNPEDNSVSLCDDYQNTLEHVKYIHQIQNLYHAHTGMDLNFQPVPLL